MDNMSIKEQIKILAARKGLTLADVAERTGQTRQNLSLAFRRGTYSTEWLERIAEALGCDLVIEFKPKA